MASIFADESGQDRTEAATPRRRTEAEREGRVPHSSELSAALVLLGATVVLAYAGGSAIARETSEFLRRDLDALSAAPLTVQGAAALLRTGGGHLLLALAPFALSVMLVALAAGLVQGRGVISAGRVTPKLENLNPLRGLGRILSLQGAFSLLKSLLKLAVLALVTYFTLRDAWPEVTGLTAVDVPVVLALLQSLAVKLALHVGFAFMLLAAGDYAFEVFQYEKSLRMTKQEVKQEAKETEGDPLIKSRIRALGRQMARKRMLRDVARADVVVTNPTHLAVALRYDPLKAGAPVVLAMGERKLAERIKAIAKQAGVPMVENRPLARALLANAKVGQQIPATLYAAVAEVLAYVYRRRAAMGQAVPR
jgi:flagellar biosynthetic protein FlhB